MKVTVITINYNNLNGLKRTIPSVLSQTCDDFEFIVIDGDSTDGSKEYIELQNGISQWVSEKDKGIYNAMNKAVSMAHGDYCIFMNSGDHFFSPFSLENACKELDGTDYCVGRTAIVDGNYLTFSIPPAHMTSHFIRITNLQHQSTFIKTSLLREYPYDENLEITSDWVHFFELWHRKKCTYKAIETITSAFYTDGISANHSKVIREERKMALDRLKKENIDMPGLKTKEEKLEWQTYRLDYKLQGAMKKKPLSRDWKVMRNGFKSFFKDLFISLGII